MLNFGSDNSEVFLGKDIIKRRDFSEDTALRIDREVKRIVDECYGRAGKLIRENIDALRKIAETLLQRETLTGEEIESILGELSPVAAA